MAEKILETTQSLIDAGWYDPALLVVRHGFELGLFAETYGNKLAQLVARDDYTLKALRTDTARANRADKEAVERGVNFSAQFCIEDRLELAARRIAHHSGRSALKLVGTTDKLWLFRQRNGLLDEQR